MARLLLHGRIDNIQTSWVKLGDEGTAGDAAGRRQRPRRHADGGDHLPDGRQRTRLRRPPEELDEIAAGIGRPARQRTTTYGVPDPARVALSYSAPAPEPVRTLLPVVAAG